MSIDAGGFVVLGVNGDSQTNGGVLLDYELSTVTLDEDELVLSFNGVEVDRVNYTVFGGFIFPQGASLLCDLSFAVPLSTTLGVFGARVHLHTEPGDWEHRGHSMIPARSAGTGFSAGMRSATMRIHSVATDARLIVCWKENFRRAGTWSSRRS